MYQNQFSKEEDLNRLLQNIQFEENQRLRFNRMPLSKKNADTIKVWENISQKLKDIETNHQTRVKNEDSEKIMRHINDFKTKGSAEALGLRQLLREWRDICRQINYRENKETINRQEIALFKQVGDDNFKNIQLISKKGETTPKALLDANPIKPDDSKRRKDTTGPVKVAKKNESSSIPPDELLRFIPYCNDIIVSSQNDPVDFDAGQKKKKKKGGK